MKGTVEGRNITINNSSVQTIHENSLEYDFDDPIFEDVQCNSSNNIPIFVATCKIQKYSRTYVSIGEKSITKKAFKHSSAHKLSESLYKDYLFSEQKEPEIKFVKPMENESEKLYYINGPTHVKDARKEVINQ